MDLNNEDELKDIGSIIESLDNGSRIRDGNESFYSVSSSMECFSPKKKAKKSPAAPKTKASKMNSLEVIILAILAAIFFSLGSNLHEFIFHP